MPLLNKILFVVVNKFCYIVKVFDIILFILFKVIASLADKIFYSMAFIFFHYLFIE